MIEELYGIRHCRDAVIARGQRVLLRVDLNVSFSEDGGRILDFTRIDAIFPTVRMLLTLGAKVILISHVGDPNTAEDRTKLSLKRLLAQLSAYFMSNVGQKIVFLDIANNVTNTTTRTNPNSTIESLSQLFDIDNEDIVLLENLRFNDGEKNNDAAFAQWLASLATVYINDAFSCTHRKHASIVGVPQFVPAYAGYHLWDELTALETHLGTNAMKKCTGRKLAIIGGKKVSTKLHTLLALSKNVDHIAVVGAMANTFLFANGYDIGCSFFERDSVHDVLDLMASPKRAQIILPTDVVLSDACTVDTESLRIPHLPHSSEKISTHNICDIGHKCIAAIKKLLSSTEIVVWNGPAGCWETAPFNNGTHCIASSIAQFTNIGRLKSVIGGGDTIAAVHATGLGSVRDFTHVSTGGGAFLEWLAYGKLPGIEALRWTKI